MRFKAHDGNDAYYIDAPTGFDAQRYAKIRNEHDAVELVRDEREEDVQLQWVGNDYSSGGTPNAKRLQVREREGATWSEWRFLQ